jgi:PhnB protein
MTTMIQPYLFFEGRTEEALEFYKKALGAEVLMMMRYKDSPDSPPPGMNPPPDKIMHACVKIGDAEVMASDGMCSGNPIFGGFSLSITARDEADAKRRFNALAAGGKVGMPLGETFFAKSFGMVHDKFGISWMVIAGQKEPGK